MGGSENAAKTGSIFFGEERPILLPSLTGEGKAGLPGTGDFEFEAQGATFRVEVARGVEDRSAAYRFMYGIYAEKGWGSPHPSGMHYSLYELLPTAVTLLVLYRKNELVATLTTVLDSDFGLPDDENYADVLDEQRASGRKMAEVISLGVRDDMRGVRDLVTKLFNFAYFVARGIQGASDFVITVLPNHSPFYLRKMLFRRIGEPRWQKKTGVTVELLKLDFEDAERETLLQHGALGPKPERSVTVYREFFTAEEGADMVAKLKSRIAWDAEALEHFLSNKPDLWEKADSSQRDFLRRLLDSPGRSE